MTTPQHLSDRYEVGEILGFGGMSEVHMARDLRLHRDVAIKVLRADLARDPSFYLRFRREAQNAAALNHPAIVAVYDTGEARHTDRTAALHRDGVRRRRHAARRRAHRGTDAVAARHRGHRRCLPGPELQPPARHHPPRRQARQHHDQQGRRGEGDGLRHRPRAGRRREPGHPDRRGDRNRTVPVPRAGPRREGRRPLGRVLAGLRALRNAHRRAAFRR